MRVLAYLLPLVALFTLVFASCTPDVTEDNGPLLTLLQAVPRQARFDLVFDDLRALSEYEDVVIPSRSAALGEKIEWYSAIQDQMLSSVSMPLADSWGFDFVDVHGQAQRLGDPPLYLVTGTLDTKAFVSRFREHRYEESRYRRATVFTRTADSPDDSSLNLLPGAFGILNLDDSAVLAAMAGGGTWEPDNSPAGIARAKSHVEMAIDAYLDGPSLADDETANDVARLLGRVGAAYLTNDFAVDLVIDSLPENGRVLGDYVGPGHLDAYSMLAFAYRRADGPPILEIVLAFGDKQTAQRNVPIVERRLDEGRTVGRDEPLTEIFAHPTVRATGRYLRATLELAGRAAEGPLFMGDMIWRWDYLFLAPGAYGDQS